MRVRSNRAMQLSQLVRLKPDTTGGLKTCAATVRVVAAEAIDHVVATYFPAPHSYTGEDVVELSAHGSPVVLRAIVAAAAACGARLAEPGEFTLRAFLNGRIDLPQAEAVADLIDAVTPLQARAAFDQLQGTLTEAIAEIDAALFDLIARLEASIDFPDEGYHFIDQGALAGAIDDSEGPDGETAGRRRPGTARARRPPNRDRRQAERGQVERLQCARRRCACHRDRRSGHHPRSGHRKPSTSTACAPRSSIRRVFTSSADPVEAEGMARSKQAYAIADLTLVVLDRSSALDADDRQILSQTIDINRLISHKQGGSAGRRRPGRSFRHAVLVSAVTGAGLDELRRRIAASLDVDLLADRPAITNVRHIALVQRAHDALTRARSAALSDGGTLPEEFVLADLQEARVALEQVNGQRTSDDVLAHIFSRFCVGK